MVLQGLIIHGERLTSVTVWWSGKIYAAKIFTNSRAEQEHFCSLDHYGDLVMFPLSFLKTQITLCFLLYEAFKETQGQEKGVIQVYSNCSMTVVAAFRRMKGTWWHLIVKFHIMMYLIWQVLALFCTMYETNEKASTMEKQEVEHFWIEVHHTSQNVLFLFQYSYTSNGMAFLCSPMKMLRIFPHVFLLV